MPNKKSSGYDSMQSIKVNILENLENQILKSKNQKFKLNEFGNLNDSSILKMSE